MYKLSNFILNKIEQNPTVKLDLAKALGVREYQIKRLIKNNKQNGTLTKISAIKVLVDEFKVKDSKVITKTN